MLKYSLISWLKNTAMAQQSPISNWPTLMGILWGFLFRKGKGLVKMQGGCTEELREALPFFSGVQSKWSRPENTWHLQRQVCLVSGYFLCLLSSCPALSGKITLQHINQPQHGCRALNGKRDHYWSFSKWPCGMGWGGGSGWETHVCPWLIHAMYGKNHYNIVK